MMLSVYIRYQFHFVQSEVITGESSFKEQVRASLPSAFGCRLVVPAADLTPNQVRFSCLRVCHVNQSVFYGINVTKTRTGAI